MRDPMLDEHEKWFYDLGELAKVVEINRKNQQRSNRRVRIIALFVLVASLLLSYRTQNAQNRIDANTKKIAVNSEKIYQTQVDSCEAFRVIIRNFNAAQDRFIRLDKENPVKGAERLQRIRVGLLEQNKVPVPTAVCP